MFTFVLIIQTLVAVALISLILMQRSEGGGLAGGGSPAGMMSARGAADFLTRGTSILATVFICLSILLAGLAAGQRGNGEIRATRAPAAPARPASTPAPAAAPKAAAPAPAAPASNGTSIPGQ
ncbi:MAG TPA: preprotein translocase subunit SecG [Allosphingosinicella sp.]|nr:preprotein translocase subunit SecG [Allosphingosinicella sp.]